MNSTVTLVQLNDRPGLLRYAYGDLRFVIERTPGPVRSARWRWYQEAQEGQAVNLDKGSWGKTKVDAYGALVRYLAAKEQEARPPVEPERWVVLTRVDNPLGPDVCYVASEYRDTRVVLRNVIEPEAVDGRCREWLHYGYRVMECL